MIFTQEEKKTIISLRRDFFSYHHIAKTLNKRQRDVMNFCKRKGLMSLTAYKIAKTKQVGKYDHLLDEPVAEGKMHSQYLKIEKMKKQPVITVRDIKNPPNINALLRENADLKDDKQELIAHIHFLQAVDKKYRHEYGAV